MPPVAKLFLIKRYDEFLPEKDRIKVPKNTRGIYVLLKKRGESYNIVYVGMAAGDKAGIRGRLRNHSLSKTKKDKWDHFSLFEVHDNISKEIISELEGLLRHIYRYDNKSQQFNIQKKFKKLSKSKIKLANWKTRQKERG